MKAKELRLGNLINTLVGKTLGQNDMVKVEINHIKHIYDGNEYGYTPIPLTEEWLLKLGFEKAINGYWDETENWCVRENDFFLGAKMYLGKVDYVHQLQNLYFALTNKELTLDKI